MNRSWLASSFFAVAVLGCNSSPSSPSSGSNAGPRAYRRRPHDRKHSFHRIQEVTDNGHAAGTAHPL